MRQMRRRVHLSDHESGPKRCVSLPARYALQKKNKKGGEHGIEVYRRKRPWDRRQEITAISIPEMPGGALRCRACLPLYASGIATAASTRLYGFAFGGLALKRCKNRQNGRENAQTERYFRGFVGLYVARGLCYDKKAA